MKGLSYGFQVGVQSTALVLVVTSERGAWKACRKARSPLGGQPLGCSWPHGGAFRGGGHRSAVESTYLQLLPQQGGAFIGASFEGAVIDNNVNANQVFGRKA